MLFNSIEFPVFLIIVFMVYWFVFKNKLAYQNLFILFSSYVFYGWWDWRFLFLIIFSSLVDFFIGKRIHQVRKKSIKKNLLIMSLSVNLGLLAIFKYFNFFIENFQQAFSFFGSQLPLGSLEIVLPVGISFYTFQTLSYTIDIYRGKLNPSRNLIDFLAYVSFFPQLVAGPIERAGNLLPQFYQKRKFSYAMGISGLQMILWGLFKKVVIADNAAPYVDIIFSGGSELSGSTLIMGLVLFSFQIYGDFSGYSDIAIGTARLLGFNLMRNFAYPYFSRDIAEFWRRWHISLSTWFRDYLYIPLGGSKGQLNDKVRNIFVIFLVSGFWHGANWTFLIWGGLNALLFLPLLLWDKNRRKLEIVAKNSVFPSLKELGQMLSTFLLVSFTWIFFRAENLTASLDYLKGMFSASLFSTPDEFPVMVFSLISVFLLVEWFGRKHMNPLEGIVKHWPRVMRWATYLFILYAILYWSGKQQEFIYFQF